MPQKTLPFLRYARRAAAGETSLLITHSEIFTGTFASTTETTDWLIASLGFAGNTGPDHIDHLHGLGEFLARVKR